MLLDPNCVEADNEKCLRCDYEFYLNETSDKCFRCDERWDPNCFVCDHTQCLECQWPYQVHMESHKCYTGGVLEFTNTYLDVIEDQLWLYLYVRRNFDSNDTVTVRYDMTMP